jgi:hypothetical protein
MGRKLKTSTITVSKEATVNLNNCTDSTDEDKQDRQESQEKRECPVNLIRVQEAPQSPIPQSENTKAPPTSPESKTNEKVRCEHCNKSVSSRCLKYYHRCKASEKQDTIKQNATPSPTPKRPMRPRAETMIEPESRTPATEGYPSTERISQALAKARSMQARRQKDSIYDRLTFS